MSATMIILFVVLAAGIGSVLWMLAPDPSERVIRERVASEVGLGNPDEQPSSLAKALDSLAPINEAAWLEKSRRNTAHRLNSGHVALSSIQFMALQQVIAVMATTGYIMLFGQRTNWAICIGVAVVSYCLPVMWLKGRIKQRQQAIAHDLPEVVDLLSLCVDAGTDFMGAMQRVGREFKDCPLTEELNIVIQEIRVGKRRRDALRSLARRVEIPDISSFVRTLVQAERMGTGISEALRIQAEDSRMRRFYLGEKQAQKAPLKMMIPLFFFIMPVVFIIVAAPVLLEFIHGAGADFTAMQ
jgi:pilus assembly protein TadC